MYRNQISTYKPINLQEAVDQRNILNYINMFPHNSLLRENEIAHITSSGFIMDESLEYVLVIYHKIYQAWGWTGGHADGQKDLMAVAIKEAMEETGLKNIKCLTEEVMSLDILPVWGHMKNNDYVGAHLHLNAAFILIGSMDALLTVNEDETEGVKWVKANDLSRVSSEPDLVYVYDKLIKAGRRYKNMRLS
jgi:8-oxo-dGTP pyrophosphatase MutT (NUDIX family)